MHTRTQTPTQAQLWTVLPLPEREGWQDIRPPDEYVTYYEATGKCLNCRAPLNHWVHAFRHFKKQHMNAKYRYFMFKLGVWIEVSPPAYERAKQKHVPTARTKR